MRVGDMFLIIIVAIGLIFGMLLAVGGSTNPAAVPDSMGHMAGDQTNATVNIVENTTAMEGSGGGAFIVVLAIITILVSAFGFIIMFRKGFSNKYRT
jgi:hypothetical protein